MEVKKMMKEMKCVKYRRKETNTVFILERMAKGKICPGYKKAERRRINVAHPNRGEAQLSRSWWSEEEEVMKQE